MDYAVAGQPFSARLGPASDALATLAECEVKIRNETTGVMVYEQEPDEEPTVDTVVPTLVHAYSNLYDFTFTPNSPASGLEEWSYLVRHPKDGVDDLMAYDLVPVYAAAPVIPTPADESPYADATAVAAYTGITLADLPSDVTRLIARAGELVDYATLGNIDTTDADHLAAAQTAVCAQVEHWISHGEDEDTGSSIRSYSIGKTSFSYGTGGSGSGSSGDAPLCKRAHRILAAAGLLYCGARVGVGRQNSQPI